MSKQTKAYLVVMILVLQLVNMDKLPEIARISAFILASYYALKFITIND